MAELEESPAVIEHFRQVFRYGVIDKDGFPIELDIFTSDRRGFY